MYHPRENCTKAYPCHEETFHLIWYSLTVLTRSLYTIGLQPTAVLKLQEQKLMDEKRLMDLSEDSMRKMGDSLSVGQLEILRVHRRDLRKRCSRQGRVWVRACAHAHSDTHTRGCAYIHIHAHTSIQTRTRARTHTHRERERERERWCFEPRQPQRFTSGLNTSFTLSQSYSFHKSSYHKSCFF